MQFQKLDLMTGYFHISVSLYSMDFLSHKEGSVSAFVYFVNQINYTLRKITAALF